MRSVKGCGNVLQRCKDSVWVYGAGGSVMVVLLILYLRAIGLSLQLYYRKSLTNKNYCMVKFNTCEIEWNCNLELYYFWSC